MVEKIACADRVDTMQISLLNECKDMLYSRTSRNRTLGTEGSVLISEVS